MADRRELYADSAQARRQDRDRDGPAGADWSADEEALAFQVDPAVEARNKEQSKARVQRAIGQMENFLIHHNKGA